MKIMDYLLQIIFIPLFTILLIIAPELYVKIVLSIAIVILSLLTGFSLGLEWRNTKDEAKQIAKETVDTVKAVKELYMEQHECVINNEAKEKMDKILTDVIWASLVEDFYE